MDLKTNEELANMTVEELAGYYNTINEVKSAEIDNAIKSKSSKEEVAKLYNDYKKDTETQLEKLNSVLIEQGLKIKKLTDVSTNDMIVSNRSLRDVLAKKINNLKGLSGSLSEAKDNDFAIKMNTPIVTKEPSNMTRQNTVVSGNENGGLPLVAREPGVYDERRSTLGFLPFVDQSPISSNVITWVKKIGRANAAGAIEEEGSPKPQSDFKLVVEQAFVKKYANYIKVSTEMLSDISFLQSEINRELVGNLLEIVDKDCFTGKGDAGIKGMEENCVEFDAQGFTTTEPNILDVLVVAMNCLESKYYYKASRIFMHPNDVMKLKLTKDKNANYIERLIITADGMSLDGVAITSTTHIEPGKYFVADMSQIRMYVKEDMQLEFGMSGNDFTENLRTILTEWRGVLRYISKEAIVCGDFKEDQGAISQEG